MYLVELRPGKEEVYRTLEEFTAAIRRGDVIWQSRIYHQAASMWIPITLHPQFRKIAGERRADPPWPPLRRRWTFDRNDTPEERPVFNPALEEDAWDEQPRSWAERTVTRGWSPRGWRSVLGGLLGGSQA
jgi:hypothetical protein